MNILFLCTGNSARSILAEVIVNQHLTRPEVTAFSAGSQPNGVVNPGAIEELSKRGLCTDGLAPKSWDEFTSNSAEFSEDPAPPEKVPPEKVPPEKAPPDIDLIVTLCDSAAAETCPVFPGSGTKQHWGFPDPASGAATFPETFDNICARVEQFYAELDNV